MKAVGEGVPQAVEVHIAGFPGHEPLKHVLQVSILEKDKISRSRALSLFADDVVPLNMLVFSSDGSWPERGLPHEMKLTTAEPAHQRVLLVLAVEEGLEQDLQRVLVNDTPKVLIDYLIICVLADLQLQGHIGDKTRLVMNIFLIDVYSSTST
jgi:hypothetical protein